jgi:WD40 repeat protein
MNFRITLLTLALFFSSTLYSQTDSFDRQYMDHFGNVEVATFSMNGKLFATGGWDDMVNVYSGDSQTLISSLYGHGAAVKSISIARNNKMIVSGGNDRKVNLWRWVEEDQMFMLDSIVGTHNYPVNTVIIGPGMRTIFSASADGEIQVHNLTKKRHKIIKHPREITTIAISNNRQKIFCADASSKITVYNPFGKVITSYEGHSDQINSIAVARNNRYIVTGSNDKTVIVWDIVKGKEFKRLEGHDWKVSSVDISFDGKYVVSGSIDGVCILWDLASGEKLKTFTVSNGQVKSVAISPNKEFIVAAIAFESLSEFGETGAVIWKTGFVRPKSKKKRTKKSSAPTSTTAKTEKSSAVKSQDSKDKKELIKKDGKIEISIE